ncbi:MAG: DUF4041 domain-containing protein [Planctomycetota bacterium]|nr:DUF4041 domain-containing protein [Planctomycetota bacterium]
MAIVLSLLLFLATFAACAMGVLFFVTANNLAEATQKMEKSESALQNFKNDQENGLEKNKKLKRIAIAFENKINGYGDEYLIPIESVIDRLGDSFSNTEPGKEFKAAKKRIKSLIKDRLAAISFIDDVDRNTNAVEFVLDAFLGKAETIIGKVKSDNYGKLLQELADAFELVNMNGVAFSTAISNDFLVANTDKLRWASIIQKIKKDQQEEQSRIREQLREDERVRKEIEKTQYEAAKEEEILQKAMAVLQEKMGKANAAEKENLEQEVATLKDKLLVAEEKGKRARALSMAQQTTTGHFYIISNIGSFGEGVFKIGLTRRLDPQERIDELGDSSVPFEFDVHALIKADDAPALENQLHKFFVLHQVNKVNHRKEFFRVPLTEIRDEISKLGLDATWTMTAEAIHFKESRYIDHLIATNPDARKAWVSRQLQLDLYGSNSPAIDADGDADENPAG